MVAAACLGYGASAEGVLRELFGGVGGKGAGSGAGVCAAGECWLNERVCVSAKGILFDMDGVLISSIEAAVRNWKRWAKRYGVPNPDEFVIPHGVRSIDLVKMLRPDIDPQEGQRAIEDMEVEDVADLKVLPGVKVLLESLPPERWAIVTSATRRLLLARLKAAGLPVPERIITADDVERGEPDPEPYRRGAELLG